MDRPYLVILSGWGTGSIAWNKLEKFLSKNFRLIFVDWVCTHSLDEFKERAVKIIEEKKISDFSILGWSLGSLVAQDIAADNLWNIKCLILIDGTSSFVQHGEDGYNIGWNERIVKMMKSQLYKRPEEVLTNFYKKMFSREESRNGYDIEFLQMKGHKIKSPSIDSLALGLDYLMEKDLRYRLININAPLLMIHGEKDIICPLNAAFYIKNMIRHSSLEIIKHSGHIPFFTKPYDCYKAISEFILKTI